MTHHPLSFTELERRIKALPEGPVAVLNRPRWQTPLDVIGLLGIVLGVLPSILIAFMTPRDWMVDVAHIGLLLTAAFIPGFVRDVWVIGRSLGKWRTEQVAQLDHDLQAMRALQDWLARIPRDEVAMHLRFARDVQGRLAHKIAFIAGGLDKLGVMPLLFAFAVQLRVFFDGSVSPWWASIAMLAAVSYGVGAVASLMRLRLQLYEALLDNALQRRL